MANIVASDAQNPPQTPDLGRYTVHIFERNSSIYLLIIAASITLAIIVNPWLILLWPTILLLDDIAYFAFARSLFDTEIAIQRACQFVDWFLDNQSGDGRDLGLNLYNGDLTKAKAHAQQDKWDFLLEKLDLNPGDKLIDIGCGYGDWLNYACTKGIEVVGINMSPEQSRAAHELYDIDVIITNWKDIPKTPALRDRLYGQFDAVTFMDSVEHFVPSMYRFQEEKIGAIYTAMFALAHDLLKVNSPVNKVFISCLHMTNQPKTLNDYFACYLQTRFYSGFYPHGDDGLVQWSTDYFLELERHDKTEDYRITSVLDPDHFGAPVIKWTPRKAGLALLAFLIDPHHLHKWMEYRVGAWMWHFGPDAFNEKYDSDHRKSLSRVTLWWIVLQKKSNRNR